jgi:hypothetical protein
MKTVLEALTAFGTIAVAVIAIWGDWLKSKLAPQKLDLELDPEAEAVTYANGVRGIFRHLKVVNLRPRIPAQQCRVMLVGLSRRDPGGGYQPVALAFPCQFTWAPMEFMPITPTVMKGQVVDLGFINENQKSFLPKLYSMPYNFQGGVGENEAMRYQVLIEAVNYISNILVIEVAWDGIWDFDPNVMRYHLSVNIKRA